MIRIFLNLVVSFLGSLLLLMLVIYQELTAIFLARKAKPEPARVMCGYCGLCYPKKQIHGRLCNSVRGCKRCLKERNLWVQW